MINQVQRDVWTNLSVDVERYYHTLFPCSKYCTLNAVTIFPYCKLKALYVSKSGVTKLGNEKQLENLPYINKILLPDSNQRNNKACLNRANRRIRPVSVLTVKRKLNERTGTADNDKRNKGKHKDNSLIILETKEPTLNNKDNIYKSNVYRKNTSLHSVKHSSIQNKENVASLIQNKAARRRPLIPKRQLNKDVMLPPIVHEGRYPALELLKEGGRFNSFQGWDKCNEEECAADEVIEEISTKRNESGKNEFKGVSSLYLLYTNK